MGVDFNSIKDDAGWNLFLPARIIFPNLNAFLAFQPVVFWWPVLQGAPQPVFDVPFTDPLPDAWPDDATLFDLDYNSVGAFVQDQWTATSRLTINYGVRYDLESYPDRFISKQDTNNFQPRLGLAYAYSPKGVVRAGFGIFNDRLVSSVGQVFTATDWSSRGDSPNALRLFPNVARIAGRFRQTTVAGPGAPAAATTFLTTGRVPAAGATSLTDNMSSELVNPFSYQASAQIAQDLGNGFAISASYLFVKGQDLPGHGANLNAVQTGTLSTGKPIIGGRQLRRARQLPRHRQHRLLGVPRRHDRAAEAVPRRHRVHGVVHAGPGQDERGVRHQPGRLPGRARHVAGGWRSRGSMCSIAARFRS